MDFMVSWYIKKHTIKIATLSITKKAKKEKIANEKHTRRDESFAKPAPLALLAIRTPLKLDVADCMFIVLFFFSCCAC